MGTYTLEEAFLENISKHRAKISNKEKYSLDHISLPTLRRLPYYYNIMITFEKNGFKYVSSAVIAKQLGIDDTQVRKDIASTGYIGKPKVGFNTVEFKEHLEDFLGLKEKKEAVLVGAGNLGQALTRFPGFANYGLNISFIFDQDPNKIGQKVNNKEILPMTSLELKVKKKSIQYAILTMRSDEAQNICNKLVSLGVKAIWNFTDSYLEVPDDVFVWNENLAASFITLSHLVERKK